MLVVDANVAVAAARVADGFTTLGGDVLVAPPLMWSEARSGLHEAAWRRDIDRATADRIHERLLAAPIEPAAPAELGQEAWRIADDFGWARTYYAEYVALASILGCRLVTLDGRLWRGTRKLGFVVSPAEL